MPKLDPVDALIVQKRAACISIRKEIKLAKSKRKQAEWTCRLKKETDEIEALVRVQRQLLGLRAVKTAARSM